MVETVRLEFLALVPTMFSHCQHCMDLLRESGLKVHSQQFNEYPEDVKRTLLKISDLMVSVNRDFQDRVKFRLTDFASPVGFLKSLRYRVRGPIAVLINGRKIFDGLPDYEVLKAELMKTFLMQIQTR
ncbi:hypothetical protein KEJ51_02635 [Candidatus Bathyarchaeota archaeon]|nr:hypothetical protein [Candidatus Bathyarchaeota archaeon]MBS7628573.1 hypothetical protein [Candidatus Bathyarchaeota archaeon]